MSYSEVMALIQEREQELFDEMSGLEMAFGTEDEYTKAARTRWFAIYSLMTELKGA